jgi:predicted transcriptional regulator
MTRVRQPRAQGLGQAEQAVMNHVWRHGPVTADECRAALAASWPMKDSTIRTVLRRLETKGYVTHTVDGRTYRYEAVHAPLAVATRAVRQIIDRFCGGSAEALVLGMVDDRVLDAGELERIAKRIARARGSRP